MSRARCRSAVLALLPVALVCACGGGAPEPTVLPLLVSVKTDGLPLPGAIVSLGSERRGITPADGLVRTSAAGFAGTAVVVVVTCPAGHHNEHPVVPFVLGPPSGELPTPRRIEVDCARDRAEAVVVVRGRGRTLEPVQIDGRTVGQLDAEGLAHVLVAMAPQTRFQVSVGASAADSAQRATFTMPVREDVFFFDAPPRAAVETPRPQRRPGGRRVVHLPQRLPRVGRMR